LNTVDIGAHLFIFGAVSLSMTRLAFLILAAVAAASPSPNPAVGKEFSELSELLVTPEDFGAVGDGMHNDWEPIKRALAACSEQEQAQGKPTPCRVVFGSNAHYLTGPLVVNSSSTTLEINGLLAMLPKARFCAASACKGDGVPGAFITNAPGIDGCRTITPPGALGGYEVCLSDITITGTGTVASTKVSFRGRVPPFNPHPRPQPHPPHSTPAP
jgi:hypothetical protein